MSAFRIVSLLFVFGCYGSAPPTPPRVPLPDLIPGEEVTVTSVSETSIENVPKKVAHCPHGHIEGSQACSYSTYTAREPVTRTKTTAHYGNTTLSRPQLAVMADTEHDAKRERLAKLQQTCTSANTPRLVGLAGVVGGLVLWGIAAGTQQAAFTYAGIGAFAIGAGAYTYGYFRGGSACGEARDMVADLAYGRKYSVSEQSEMEDLARQFNERVRTGTATTPSTNPTSSHDERSAPTRRRMSMRR